jgi:hypothetical protein
MATAGFTINVDLKQIWAIIKKYGGEKCRKEFLRYVDGLIEDATKGQLRTRLLGEEASER